MPKVVFSDAFLREAKKLPSETQRKLAKNLAVFQCNPFHPSLHAKALSGDLTGFYSFRITRDWRVIFQFLEPEVIKLIDVGHRKDIYR